MYAQQQNQRTKTPDRRGVSLQRKCKACLLEEQGTNIAQRQSKDVLEEEEDAVQMKKKAGTVLQKKNTTGIPDRLKSGMETMTGYNLDHVKVHYNSPKPATVQAHAYAQGNNIHIASGQEKHLPHELGHVVQQMQGRVKPTTSVNGMAVNDSPALESDADRLGRRALHG